MLVESEVTTNVHAPADASLGIDHLAAVLGPHAGAEAELTGTLDEAASLGVMRGHDLYSWWSKAGSGGNQSQSRGKGGLHRGLFDVDRHVLVSGQASGIDHPQRDDVRA